jgi:outer membrane murein-binding lipoprotein Lpp
MIVDVRSSGRTARVLRLGLIPVFVVAGGLALIGCANGQAKAQPATSNVTLGKSLTADYSELADSINPDISQVRQAVADAQTASGQFEQEVSQSEASMAQGTQAVTSVCDANPLSAACEQAILQGIQSGTSATDGFIAAEQSLRQHETDDLALAAQSMEQAGQAAIQAATSITHLNFPDSSAADAKQIEGALTNAGDAAEAVVAGALTLTSTLAAWDSWNSSINQFSVTYARLLHELGIHSKIACLQCS